ncbi:unnamed protein product [Cylicostephanus goldi]|uniref:Uncharacterized protein n=1 Tax=Cylicostephanus goldi TaxID=71465 RepID=A0A3P6RMK3_CYLGO|nr:unnamed protein product [Cylicostephanus goldi]
MVMLRLSFRFYRRRLYTTKMLVDVPRLDVLLRNGDGGHGALAHECVVPGDDLDLVDDGLVLAFLDDVRASCLALLKNTSTNE